MLHSICQQIWKTQQWPQNWKRSVFIPIPKKGNAKECSDYCTIVLTSHAGKVMFKTLQARRLQQYVNQEHPGIQAGFRKGRGTRDQIANNCWVIEKAWCFWTVVLEKTLESPLYSKEIQPVLPKGNQSWIFICGTEAEVPILWPPDSKNWLIWKDPDSGKDWSSGRRDDREWDGWMASPTQWTWVWVGSRSWWWTGKPGVLQSMGSHSRTWLNDWTELKIQS